MANDIKVSLDIEEARLMWVLMKKLEENVREKGMSKEREVKTKDGSRIVVRVSPAKRA